MGFSSRPITRRRLAAAALALAACPLAATRADATLCVNPRGSGACYSSIQAALDAADAGETVRVAPGTYRETLTVNQAGVHLVGTGRTPGLVRVDGSRGGILGITVNAADVLIGNLEVRGTLAHGVRSGAPGTRLSRVRIAGVTGNCVHLEGSGAGIVASRIQGCSAGYGIEVAGDDALVRGVSVSRSRGFRVVGNRTRVLSTSVSRSTDWGIYHFGDSPLVRGCRVSGVAGNGIWFEGVGLNDSAGPAVIEGNRVSATASTAITGLVSGGAVISANLVAGGTPRGISLSCTADCDLARVSGNTVRGTAPGETAVSVWAADPGLEMSDNRAIGNGGAGFVVGGAGVVLRANVARGNGVSPTGGGFEVAGTGHRLVRNVAAGNTGPGFSVAGDAHELAGNRAEGNLGGGFAVGVAAPAGGVALTGATAVRNLFTGIAVTGVCPGCTVEDSRAAGNSAWDYCGSADPAGNDFGTVCP